MRLFLNPSVNFRSPINGGKTVPDEVKIEMVPLSDLKPYEKNPRRNDEAVDYVANSIREFGFKVPIIVDKNNVIIAGHTRYKAGLKLGLEEVPVIRAEDLTPEQVKAFRLADNKTSEKAGWDYSLLDEELADIGEIVDMEMFGFESAPEIDVDEFFKPVPESAQSSEEAPKTIVCPHCGEVINLEGME